VSVYIVAAILAVPPSAAFCVVGVVAVRRAYRKDIPDVLRALVRASPRDECARVSQQRAAVRSVASQRRR